MVHLGDVSPSVWDEVIEVMEQKLKHVEFQEEDIAFNWRVPADLKMLDRELYEKYGMFKDIILHPKFQYCKQLAEENVNFDFVLGDSLMPLATAVIVLFMMHKRVSNNILLLAASFIFNVNPFYICLAVLTWFFTKSGSKKPKFYVSNNIKRTKDTKGRSDEAVVYNEEISFDDDYDHILIGNDLSTLYTAALLSKNGHKCCVFQAKGAAPNTCFPEGAPFSVNVRNPALGKIDRYQSLLDIVQRKDKANRVTFVPLGSEEDCYTHTVLKIAGTGGKGGKGGSVWPLKAGEGSLTTDVCSRLHFEKAPLTGFLKSVTNAQAAVTGYLIGKIGTVSTGSEKPAGSMWGSGGGSESAVAKADGLGQFFF
jgi:hypothetical protein